MAGYYDPNKDYSKELQRTDLSTSERSRLETERKNKIEDKYDGKEPTLWGSDKTYSQAVKDNDRDTISNAISLSNKASGMSQRDIDNATISQPGGTLYYDDGRAAVHNAGKPWQDGVDYAAEAAKYAAIGDWGGVDDVLMRREAKINDLGITGVQSNLEVWKYLNDMYNGPSAGISLSDMQAGAERAYGTSDNKQYQNLNEIYNNILGNDESYSYAPEWKGSQWDDLLNQVANELASMNYADWTKGDQYKALAERYGNEGQMSMQNVLGQIASRTGGLASSYATTAAQQQYNQFMSRLEDLARQMYSSDRSDLLDKANMYRQLGQDDYDKYLDDLGQWNMDRNFQYGVYRDSVEDQRYADETAWEREQYNSKTTESEKSAAQDRIAAYLAAGGKIADLDQDLIAASGLTTSELSAQEKYYTQQAAQKSKSTSSLSSSGSGKPTLTAAQVLKALEDGIVNDTTKAAYEYYYGQPWDDGSESKSTKKSFVNGSGVTATPLDYETIKKNSEAGNYGSKYGLVLGEIQAKFAKGADAGTLADIIDKALKNGDINEAGADTLLRALGY